MHLLENNSEGNAKISEGKNAKILLKKYRREIFNYYIIKQF